MRTTLVLACLTALAIVACSGSPSRIEGFPLTTTVLEALGDARPYYLRLHDSRRHKSCAPVDTDTAMVIPTASCALVSPVVLRRLAEVAPKVGESVRTNPSTDALWAAALLDLSSGTPHSRQLDRVISRLVEVRARDSSLALAANHLAVAHVVRASVRQDARELYTALDRIEEAWERDSMSHAISFNRAVIHSLVGTNRVARAQWSNYLNAHPAPAWRSEARERLASLETKRVDLSFALSTEGIRRDPQRAREFVLDSILPNWERAIRQGDASAARGAVNLARTVGTELLALSGDSSIWRVALSIDGADRRVVTGVRLLVRGTLAYRVTAFGEARDTLASAVRHLEATGRDALGDWARLMLGATQMAQQQLDIARQTLAAISVRARRRGDRALEARSVWAGAIAVGRAGSVDEAERMFSRSHDLFASIGEFRNAAAMLSGIADAQGATGRTLEAANSLFLANTTSLRAGGSLRYEDLLVAAQHMSDQGHHRASAHLLNEAVLAGAEGSRIKDLPESLGRLSLAQVAMGHRELAMSTIARARQVATRVEDVAMRSRLVAELDRAEAQVVADVDPARAIMLVDSARAYFATIPVDDGPLLLRRSWLAVRTGDPGRAEVNLADAIRTMRRLASAVTPEQARQLVSTLRDAHRTLIELALARGDTARAFSETVSLPSTSVRESGRLPTAEHVGSGVAQLRFVMLPSKVLSWIKVGDKHSLAQSLLAREELGSRIARFVNLVRSGEDAASMRALGNELYRSLLGAHESRLEGVSAIDVYTDGVLADLPIAVLTDDRGRFMVERFAISHVVTSETRKTALGAKIATRGSLLIGDPAWRRADFPGLEPLRFADDEVRQIAATYPRRTLLLGSFATKQAVVEEMPKHDVIHFAGHSRVVVENPGTSHVVLAPKETFREGVLYASEIATLDLRGVRLVVLSSCGRTRDDASTMDQLNGLATAFLDAGAEEVVASLWEVDDEAVVQLMKEMHNGIYAHVAAARVLSNVIAQQLLQKKTPSNSLEVMAAFVVVKRSSPAAN
jgi:CHAT domain-containing protein